MRNLLVLLITALISFSFHSYSTAPAERNDSFVYWDQGDLAWSNFKGIAPQNTEYSALTHSTLDMSYSSEGTTLTFVIESIFHPETSWKIDNIINDHILNHEQGHFDLTEYYARLYRKDVTNIKFENVNSINPQLEVISNKHLEAMNEMNILYDEETNHSANKTEQTKWDNKIAAFLEETKEYSSSIVELDIEYLLKQ